jgi:RNA recognition motif-containing protein
MDNTVFVGGLSWDTTEAGLKEFFGQVGEVVEAKIITDRLTKRSKGFGFVTYAKDEDAAKSITELDGKELDGRNIKVAKALPQRERA